MPRKQNHAPCLRRVVLLVVAADLDVGIVHGGTFLSVLEHHLAVQEAGPEGDPLGFPQVRDRLVGRRPGLCRVEDRAVRLPSLRDHARVVVHASEVSDDLQVPVCEVLVRQDREAGVSATRNGSGSGVVGHGCGIGRDVGCSREGRAHNLSAKLPGR